MKRKKSLSFSKSLPKNASVLFTFLLISLENVQKSDQIELSGNRQSFIQFETPSCRVRCNISLQFNPQSEHGLLLYMDSEGSTKDYVYIYLIDNQVGATFSSANQNSAFFTSEGFVTKYNWNEISIGRLENGVNFTFNDESVLLDGVYSDLFDRITSGLYIGGVPSDTEFDQLSFPNVYYKPHYGGKVQNIRNDMGDNW